ncbi:MAG: aminoacetone oxidase family FAD-binding enzyme, partial [Candidatus Pacebacteria bacterium]|nr:aminoacetone oxidase family FAD-binding enzyme [Candidatus Paceibacterota bacterium]
MKTITGKYDLVVIGGGPSGMMAAGRAAELGARVLLLEKNKSLGKKLLLTGGGRCNLTNNIIDTKEFLKHFPQSKEFLYSPFSKFSVQDTLNFFEKNGLRLVIEAHDRVFPKTQKAEHVLGVLERYMKINNVEIRRNMKVQDISVREDKKILIRMKDEQFLSNAAVIATGGLAAPETGSTGDGFTFLKKLGHTIQKPNPNLVPITSSTRWIHNLSGLTLSFMTIHFKQNEKTVLKKTGKILFTHFGISGPLVLNSSYEVTQLLKKGPLHASIDMFPDTEENELDRRVFNLFEKNKNKALKNILPEIVHKSM